MLKAFLLCSLGYALHDAIQPTAVGKILDKVALPDDLFVDEQKE